jgi:hypothetical protein
MEILTRRNRSISFDEYLYISPSTVSESKISSTQDLKRTGEYDSLIISTGENMSKKTHYHPFSTTKTRRAYSWKNTLSLKRNHLRVQKVRTKNGEKRSLYNYQTIGAFWDMHFDTKILADQKSLPEGVYENLKYNEHLPIYEWNIIDVASRTRFMSYSRGKSSTFGLQFLVFVLTHIRACGILTAEQG